MTTKNDITGDTLKSKPANDNYRNSKFWSNLEKGKDVDTKPIRPTMSYAANKDHYIEILLKYCSKLEAHNEKMQTLIMECTDNGELDGDLFNAYMEFAIKEKG